MKVFYAHCIAIYDTPQEERDIVLLSRLGFEVFNPNQPAYQLAYSELGIDASYGYISTCEALAFRALPNGDIPAGVKKEIDYAQELNKPIFELPHFGLRRSLSVEETRGYIRECGKR